MAKHRSRRAALLALIALPAALAVGAVAAQDAPEKAAILTVTGKVKGQSVQFDRDALEKLGTVSIETTTPWHSGTVKFEGVPLEKLMAEVGATGDKVVAVALNDYSTELPIQDFAKYHVILAMKRDGNYMSVRDKGPLFIIYPFDSDPELKSQKYYSRSIWQVKNMMVK